VGAEDHDSKGLDRHIDELEGLVFRQHELIHRLGSSGQDTTSAERFLAMLNEALESARERRVAGQEEPSG
jgi:hypothetical protein